MPWYRLTFSINLLINRLNRHTHKWGWGYTSTFFAIIKLIWANHLLFEKCTTSSTLQREFRHIIVTPVLWMVQALQFLSSSSTHMQSSTENPWRYRFQVWRYISGIFSITFSNLLLFKKHKLGLKITEVIAKFSVNEVVHPL